MRYGPSLPACANAVRKPPAATAPASTARRILYVNSCTILISRRSTRVRRRIGRCCFGIPRLAGISGERMRIEQRSPNVRIDIRER